MLPKDSKTNSGMTKLVAVILLASQTTTIFADEQAAKKVRFNRDVLPILSDACFNCHGPDAKTREADLRFDDEKSAKAARDGVPAIVPFRPQESEFIQRILSDDESEAMPPPESRRQLSRQEKETLKLWIEEGAAWEKHWAFIKPERPALPEVQNTSWPRNGIDHFILARLEKEGLKPSPQASNEKLIRRVTFDLTGLPPTPTEVSAFLADDSPDAYERLVDRLLVSPRYGETMAIPWLEAARFADTDGYQYDGPRYMWRWRDWVIDAYNQHMPFDQFTIEQLAGDLLPNASLDQKIATGFNRNHRYNSEAGIVVEEFLLENAVDRVDTTSTVWMGLTMGCARCHDHKYDPFSQKEYYQLIAYFNNVPEAGRAIKAGNSEPYIVAPTSLQQVRLNELELKIQAAKEALTSNELITRQRAWEQDVASGNSKVDSAMVLRQLNEHYPFDESLPPGAKPQSGKPLYQAGPFGKAIVFDGQTVVAVTNKTEGKGKKQTSRFSNFSCTDQYSLAFWLRPDDVKNGVIVCRQNQGMGRQGTSLELRDGHLVYSVISRWIAGAGIVETKEKLEPGKWVHVTISNDGSQRATQQKIYINGREVPVRVILNTNSNTGGAGGSEPLRLGGGPHGENFKGAIDDFRYYRRELRSQEALALAESTYVTRIAAIPASERTESQENKIRLWFNEHGPGKDVYNQYIAAIAERDRYRKTLPTSMVMQENREPKKTFVRVRGVYNSYGDEVGRNVPTVLPSMPAEYPRSRLGFAKWLVSGDNPLTARVTVNRYWQKYFGTGIVKTSEDFGIQGEKPTHPELLDWLATEFVRSGWNVAEMQKLIVTSAAYRQSSNVTPVLLERDPDNRLLARGPRVRLSGPKLRDQALFASGLLVENIGGPSVSPYQPENLWIEMSMGRRYRQSKGSDLFRRSLYTVWKRTVNPPSMAILDAADREACWVRAKRTNTPLQALTLLNETAFVESARHLGERIIREGHDDPIGFAYKVVASRKPTPQERSILTDALSDYRDEYKSDIEAAKKLIATGTTPVPKDLDPVELAVFATLANVLLNLDEVVTNE